jgi:hypothetical protein
MMSAGKGAPNLKTDQSKFTSFVETVYHTDRGDARAVSGRPKDSGQGAGTSWQQAAGSGQRAERRDITK